MQFGAELLDKSVFSAFGICYTPSLGRMVRVSLTMVFRAFFLLEETINISFLSSHRQFHHLKHYEESSFLFIPWYNINTVHNYHHVVLLSSSSFLLLLLPLLRIYPRKLPINPNGLFGLALAGLVTAPNWDRR